MLGLAAPTPYDLRFRLLGIPVRVNPFFWLVMAILSGHDNNLGKILIFVACAFVSILVHEYGHGLMARAFGYWPSEVVLYGMGGYCACEIERQTLRERLAVLACGPGAGFLLFGVVLLVGYVAFGNDPRDSLALIGIGSGVRGLAGPRSETLLYVYAYLLSINLWWGVFNLFPIWPLDGGRIAEVLLSMHDRRQGTRRAHIVGLLTAGGLAVWFLQHNQLAMGIFFVYFAFMNYQQLQAMHQSAKYGVYEDDSDWWKR